MHALGRKQTISVAAIFLPTPNGMGKATIGERRKGGVVPSNFSVALYYAARSYVELPAPAKVSGNKIEVAIPFSVIPRKLAAATPGDRLRMQFRGKDARPSPILNVRIANKQKALGRHVLELEILDWDKLARYWRVQIEAPGPPD